MQFNDVAGGSGIVQDIDFLLNTDVNSYPLAQKTRNINNRYSDVVSLILQYDYNWRWDDSNTSSPVLPIGTQNLVSGTQDYAIPGSTYLKILRVEILDSNGIYQLIQPFDQSDIDQSLTQYAGTNGLPTTYQKLGDYIRLFPVPATGSVTLTAGLKVYFQRPPNYFVSTDTTKVPGFNLLFHRLLSYGAALDYAVANSMNDKINSIAPQFNALQEQLCIFYTRRPAEQRSRLGVRQEDTR